MSILFIWVFTFERGKDSKGCWDGWCEGVEISGWILNFEKDGYIWERPKPRLELRYILSKPKSSKAGLQPTFTQFKVRKNPIARVLNSSRIPDKLIFVELQHVCAPDLRKRQRLILKRTSLKWEIEQIAFHNPFYMRQCGISASFVTKLRFSIQIRLDIHKY
jgi:hypothetical protein